MFTRCPQCKTVHSIGAEQLSQARGLVQCGPCGRSFSALSFLFDGWPSGEPHRPASGPGVTLPILEPALKQAVPDEAAQTGGDAVPVADDAAGDLPTADEAESGTEAVAGDPPAADEAAPGTEAVAGDLPAADEAESGTEAAAGDLPAAGEAESKPEAVAGDLQPEEPETAGTDGGKTRLGWGLATAALVLVTVANIGWTFRQPLLDSSWFSGLAKQNGPQQVEEQGLLRDPEKIQLVSRDMHTHPTRSGILVLSLTFVNLAARSQVYPELEVTLTDAANQPVAQRRLQPADYLRPGSDTSTGLAADVYLPVLLELGDPGDQAVGFEIRFL